MRNDTGEILLKRGSVLIRPVLEKMKDLEQLGPSTAKFPFASRQAPKRPRICVYGPLRLRPCVQITLANAAVDCLMRLQSRLHSLREPFLVCLECKTSCHAVN